MADKAPASKDDKPDTPGRNFIEDIIAEHNANGRFGGRVHTRFPPGPNGYPHLGHAKSIGPNYGLPQKYCGMFNPPHDHPTHTETEP